MSLASVKGSYTKDELNAFCGQAAYMTSAVLGYRVVEGFTGCLTDIVYINYVG